MKRWGGGRRERGEGEEGGRREGGRGERVVGLGTYISGERGTGSQNAIF